MFAHRRHASRLRVDACLKARCSRRAVVYMTVYLSSRRFSLAAFYDERAEMGSEGIQGSLTPGFVGREFESVKMLHHPPIDNNRWSECFSVCPVEKHSGAVPISQAPKSGNNSRTNNRGQSAFSICPEEK